MIKQVREFYGIPQNVLAGYLKVSRSHLSMAESGRRDLPIASFAMLVKFYTAMSQTNSKTAGLKTSLKGQNEKTKKLSKEELIICRHQLMTYERALKKLQNQQSKALNIFASLEILSKAVNEKDSGILDIIKLQARKLQNTTGPDKQLKLEIKIKGLEAAIRHLEKL